MAIKTSKNNGNWKKLIVFYLLFSLALIVMAFAAWVIFEQFLQIAVPALVFVTGICWALRTANVHQYEMTERTMEAYIYLYNASDGKLREGYKQIIVNYNQSAKEDLPNAEMFSYMTLYVSFAAVFLFAAEIIVVIYKGYPLSQDVRWVWFVLAILAFLFLVLAFVSLRIRLFSNNMEKCKCFRKYSRWLANIVYILEDNWIKFYRNDGWRKFYNELIEWRRCGESSEKPNEPKLHKELKPGENKLNNIIQENDWIIEELLRAD